ncbi:hypothetical protein DTO169C6_3575 [Paecilomyces variotii]|nr:hypothetical protein DTO169C6_3575 [Paecilomyces variotii]
MIQELPTVCQKVSRKSSGVNNVHQSRGRFSEQHRQTYTEIPLAPISSTKPGLRDRWFIVRLASTGVRSTQRHAMKKLNVNLSVLIAYTAVGLAFYQARSRTLV